MYECMYTFIYKMLYLSQRKQRIPMHIINTCVLNMAYQEGSICCCDRSMRLDESWLQFGHLLHAGGPDTIILSQSGGLACEKQCFIILESTALNYDSMLWI